MRDCWGSGSLGAGIWGRITGGRDAEDASNPEGWPQDLLEKLGAWMNGWTAFERAPRLGGDRPGCLDHGCGRLIRGFLLWTSRLGRSWHGRAGTDATAVRRTWPCFFGSCWFDRGRKETRAEAEEMDAEEAVFRAEMAARRWDHGRCDADEAGTRLQLGSRL